MDRIRITITRPRVGPGRWSGLGLCVHCALCACPYQAEVADPNRKLPDVVPYVRVVCVVGHRQRSLVAGQAHVVLRGVEAAQPEVGPELSSGHAHLEQPAVEAQCELGLVGVEVVRGQAGATAPRLAALAKAAARATEGSKGCSESVFFSSFAAPTALLGALPATAAVAEAGGDAAELLRRELEEAKELASSEGEQRKVFEKMVRGSAQ